MGDVAVGWKENWISHWDKICQNPEFDETSRMWNSKIVFLNFFRSGNISILTKTWKNTNAVTPNTRYLQKKPIFLQI